MSNPFEEVLHKLQRWAEGRSIQVSQADMPAGTAGEFDGAIVTLNRRYRPEEHTYYLAHALGSIVGWSLDRDGVDRMFEELRTAKNEAPSAQHRLEQAIASYRAFETASSEFAVGLLRELGCAAIIDSYSNFMRADLESLTLFHRESQAPVWRDFFAGWNAALSLSNVTVEPFSARPIPAFHPVKIDKQQILQQQP